MKSLLTISEMRTMMTAARCLETGFSGGLCLGPFTVDWRGLLCPSSPDQFPAFTVRWQGRPIRARMLHGPDHAEADGCARLEFVARLGFVPSTAAAARVNLRDGALRVLRQLPALTPRGWQLFVRPDHSVEIGADISLMLPVSAVSLITETTRFLLELTPYLDVLDEAGVEFGSDGRVKT